MVMIMITILMRTTVLRMVKAIVLIMFMMTIYLEQHLPFLSLWSWQGGHL